MRDLRYRFEAWAVRALLGAFSLLPLTFLLMFAHALGWLGFWLWPSRRRIAIDNLMAAGLCPDKASASCLAQEAFRNFVVMLAESFVLRRRFTRENWQQFVTLRWSETTRALVERSGQGLILASAHIGNWEAGIHAGSMIRPVVLVHRPLSNPYLREVALNERDGHNVTLLSSLDHEPFRFLEALSEGQILALMTDQHAGDQRVRVNFFGRPAWTTKTVAMLHLTTRVPLVSAFCLRTGPLRYEIQFTNPVECPRTGDRERDALHITQLLTDEVEKVARQFPGQYMWGHRRWKP
jgi:KDO2-lipid IV(A) lauroyltransferase